MLPMLEQSTTHEIKDTDNGTPIGSLQTHEKKNIIIDVPCCRVPFYVPKPWPKYINKLFVYFFRRSLICFILFFD